MPALHLSWLTLATTGGAAIVIALLLFARLRREKQHFQAVFDNATVGMARSTVHRRWIEVNPALCQMLGAPAEVLTSCDWMELTHPDDRTNNQQLFDAVLRDERDGFTLEKRFLRPDGSIVFVNLEAQAIRKASRQVDYFTVVIEDMTQRRQAEQQFAKQVARSAVLIELPRQAEKLDEHDLMRYALEQVETLTNSRIGFMHLINNNARSIELVAWSHLTQEQPCATAGERTYPISLVGIWADAARTGQPLVINEPVQTDNRRALPAGAYPLNRLLSIPVVENGGVRMMTCVGNKDSDYDDYDIETVQLIASETWRIVCRQRVDRALRLAMQVVNASPVVCFRWAAGNGWPVVFVSDNVRQWGYTPEQLQSGQLDFASIVHPDDLPRIAEEVMKHTASGAPGYEQEYRLITASKQVIWVVDRTQVTRDQHGLPLCYDGVLTDISERRQQQLLLAENLAHQQQLNKRLEEATNQLLQSEKMASIGQLAAGIAHELNNPIGFVHSNLGTLDGYINDMMTIVDAYASILAAQGEDSPGLKAIAQLRDERDFDFMREDIFNLLTESKDGIGRVRKIVQDLKTFSRVGEQDWQEADLHQGLDSTLNIVWNELKYKCQVVKEYGELPPVYCLISQLNQVFMNLLVNAGHAIEHKGTITLRSGRLGSDRVFIEIADTGCGIAPDKQHRIFEPFFTTKPVGKGTGLGLSVSYNIVKRHQGEITVTSTPGQGTTFRIILPIHPAPLAAQEQPE
ncbi:MAG: PAS domain-containing protein [Azonexus sp.]|jgi:PAS domain S-box-containing protein|nr:PAS domain-containing protein [Azonexus sp.]